MPVAAAGPHVPRRPWHTLASRTRQHITATTYNLQKRHINTYKLLTTHNRQQTTDNRRQTTDYRLTLQRYLRLQTNYKHRLYICIKKQKKKSNIQIHKYTNTQIQYTPVWEGRDWAIAASPLPTRWKYPRCWSGWTEPSDRQHTDNTNTETITNTQRRNRDK